MRGDGRLYKQPGTPYYYCAYYLRGKQYRQSTGETEPEKAEKFLKRKLKEVHADQIGARTFIGPAQERTTVSDLLDGLKRDYKLRDKWSERIASTVKPLREYFGNWRAIDVTADAVGEYIEDLKSDYAPASINRFTQILKQAYKLAIRDKKVQAAPHIPRLSEVGNERQGFFEKDDFDRVVAHLPERLQDFARCGFLIGWRKGALKSLRWSDVTDDVLYLRAMNSKSRKPETVPLEGELKNIIDRRRAQIVYQGKDGQAHFSEYVFHEKGRAIGDCRRAWATACSAAGVGKFVCPSCCGDVNEKRECAECARAWKQQELKYTGALFHDFRRTAARNLVRAGVPVPVAMKITGHRTDSMFRRYAIVNEDQKREALAKAQAYLAAATERKVVAMTTTK